MNQPTRPPAHLPVLTEVLEVPLPAHHNSDPLNALPEIELSFPPSTPSLADEADLPPLGLVIDLEHMAQRVQANVQIQLEHLLEARLREAMAPLLAQQADALVQGLKVDMAQALSDMVARAVDQEITRKTN
jgi:hypothetical protein